MNWRGNRRSDGYTVEKLDPLGNFVVVNPNGMTIMDVCPCCDKEFFTAKAAKLACDAFTRRWDPASTAVRTPMASH